MLAAGRDYTAYGRALYEKNGNFAWLSNAAPARAAAATGRPVLLQKRTSPSGKMCEKTARRLVEPPAVKAAAGHGAFVAAASVACHGEGDIKAHTNGDW